MLVDWNKLYFSKAMNNKLYINEYYRRILQKNVITDQDIKYKKWVTSINDQRDRLRSITPQPVVTVQASVQRARKCSQNEAIVVA